MVKKITPFIIALVLVSCSKKTNEQSVTDSNDSTQVSSTSTDSVATTSLATTKEYTVEQVSELVGTKNDTLYVTNFFATWCGPCIRELPHFVEQQEKRKAEKIKFTYISLDQKQDWGKVLPFATEHKLSGEIVLLDGMNLTPDFFTQNFSQWNGESIPYTFMRKGEKTDETIGMMSKEELERKIQSLN